MWMNPRAIASLAVAFALPAIAGPSAAADENCAPCAQARSQTVRLLAQPAPQSSPSGQAGGVPSCLGGTGPCWPSQYTGPCFPEIPPRWINPPTPVNVTPQSQIPGANAPCMPCQNYPSFYCPPTLAPARAAIPLHTAGALKALKPVPYESLFPSSQILSSSQATPENQAPAVESAPTPPETPPTPEPAGAIDASRPSAPGSP